MKTITLLIAIAAVLSDEIPAGIDSLLENDSAPESCGCSGLTREKIDTDPASYYQSLPPSDSIQQLANLIRSDNAYDLEDKNSESLNDLMVTIPSGNFYMGLDNAIIRTDGETPRRHVSINEFKLDKYE